jgi:hypothetical protein
MLNFQQNCSNVNETTDAQNTSNCFFNYVMVYGIIRTVDKFGGKIGVKVIICGG